MLVYLDTCSIQRPFDDQSQSRIAFESEAVLRLIQRVEQGDIDLVASEALLFETEQNPHPRRRRFALATLGLARHLVSVSPEIEERARAYNQAGARPLDALHLASAVESEADVFCTTDDQLLHFGRRVQTNNTVVLNPVELIERLES